MGNKKLKSEEWCEDYSPEDRDYLESEYRRCKDDIIYFAQNYYYIMTETGKKIISCFTKQSELIRYFQDNQLCVVLASRQTGKTTAYSIYITWKILFHRDINVLIAGNKAATARGILRDIKDAIQRLPWDMKPGVVEWNKGSIILSNGCTVSTTSTSSDAARGSMAHLLIVDEAAFIHPPELAYDFWKSISPIISSGQNTQVIMVSTPCGASGLFYDTYEKGRLGIGEFNWSTFRIDYWDRPGREKGGDWERKNRALLNHDDVAFDQEYGNKFTGSSYTLVPGELISEYKEKLLKTPHPFTVFPLNILGCEYSIKIYEQPIRGHAYVSGVDVADGVGSDSSTITVWDVTNLNDIRLVASFKSSNIQTPEFAYIISRLSSAYYNATIACESNSIGRAVLNDLGRVYNYENLVSYGSSNDGILSHLAVKSHGCRWLRSLLSDDFHNIDVRDEDIIAEMELFEKDFKKSKDVYRAKGSRNHDDMMMSWIWAMVTLHEDLIDDHYEVIEYRTNMLGVEIPYKLKPMYDDLSTVVPLSSLTSDINSKFEQRYADTKAIAMTSADDGMNKALLRNLDENGRNAYEKMKVDPDYMITQNIPEPVEDEETEWSSDMFTLR